MNLAHELETDVHEMDHMWENDFGFGIHPMDLLRPRAHHALTLPRRRFSPYARSLMLARRHPRIAVGTKSAGDNALGLLDGDATSIAVVPTVGKDGFQVCMDVSHFKPNELTVKTVDNTVVVEGKHEEREDDHGLIQRHFVRKYTLPKDYDAKEVVSTISSDGVLTVKAPPPPNKAIKQKERIVQIQQTGPAHLSVKAPIDESGATATTVGAMEKGKGQAQNGGEGKAAAATAIAK